MALDKDLVRVDILRIKRKIYLSLKTKEEKKQFLVASKLSELSYLQRLIPQDMVDHIFYEYRKELKNQLIDILLSLNIGIAVSLILWAFHKIYPHNILFCLWGIGFGLGLGNSIKHCIYIYEDWIKMKPFEQDYQNVKKKISNLWEEMIKDMK